MDFVGGLLVRESKIVVKAKKISENSVKDNLKKNIQFNMLLSTINIPLCVQIKVILLLWSSLTVVNRTA